MEDSFAFPVQYKGEEILFPASLQQTGYTHRFEVDVYGTPVYFEPDEERSYRAIVDPESTGHRAARAEIMPPNLEYQSAKREVELVEDAVELNPIFDVAAVTLRLAVRRHRRLPHPDVGVEQIRPAGQPGATAGLHMGDEILMQRCQQRLHDVCGYKPGDL